MKLNTSIERLVITRLLKSKNREEIEKLCRYRESFYGEHREYEKFIFDYYDKYRDTPDIVSFVDAFDVDPDSFFLDSSDNVDYLVDSLKNNKRLLMLEKTLDTLRKVGPDDLEAVWTKIRIMSNQVGELDESRPRDIIKESEERAANIIDLNKAARIPTGFDEIDKLMYGGLSTVEELCLIVARTNTGKSWVCTKMMESAQRHGFPSLCYSPEMQADFLGTRFDTWRGQFKNSNIQRGIYSDEYKEYLKELKNEKVSAFILEDKDMPDNEVTVSGLAQLVKELGIKLLLIDGLSYMKDEEGSTQDHIKYKNLASGLFKLSKQYGCAVVVTMQANRETKEEKDDKGVALPTLYNVESSDAPARICTQAFCMRQIFEQHLLEIRMEKSRTAANTKPLFTYQWNPGDGDMSLYSEDVGNTQPTNTTSVAVMNYSTPGAPQPIMPAADSDDDDDEDVEF